MLRNRSLTSNGASRARNFSPTGDLGSGAGSSPLAPTTDDAPSSASAFAFFPGPFFSFFFLNCCSCVVETRGQKIGEQDCSKSQEHEKKMETSNCGSRYLLAPGSEEIGAAIVPAPAASRSAAAAAPAAATALLIHGEISRGAVTRGEEASIPPNPRPNQS
jgi:hypothetical protein